MFNPVNETNYLPALTALRSNSIFPAMETLQSLDGPQITGLKVEEHGLIFSDLFSKIKALCPAFQVHAVKPFIYIKTA